LWLAPHFEKMLYNNAQLIDLLTLVWQRTREPLFETRVHETVGWVLREMIAEGGGFASTIDADSEGEEGRFYVWTESEIEQVLGDDATTFKKAYDLSAGGNWEGTNILNRLRVPRLDDDADEARLGTMRDKLWHVRQQRERPGWDDKVLADWNGLMIGSLAKAGAAFDQAEWINAARKAYHFVVETMIVDGRLAHSFRLGKSRHTGLLDDYANMARAGLILYEIDGDDAYLSRAKEWVTVLDAHFWDADNGGYFLTDDTVEHLIARTKSAADSALPAGNGVILEVLARLFLITGEPGYQDRADELLSAFSGYLDTDGIGLATFLNSFELLAVSLQIVIIGERGTPETQMLVNVIRDSGIAARVMTVIAPDTTLPIGHPAHGKTQLNSQPTAYVCTGQTCSLPITNAKALVDALPKSRATTQGGASA